MKCTAMELHTEIYQTNCIRPTSKLTGPEQRDGICASVFAGTNAGTLCRVRLSDLLGVAVYVHLMIFKIRFVACCQ